MANITEELQVIASGRYGKDVRVAIHDGIEKINNEATDYTSKIATVTSEIATHTSEIASLSTATSELSSEVTYIGSEVAVNTSDIADLKNKPSSALVLTSASPLATSSASNILGIECEGKSEQHISKNLLNVTMRSGTTGGINYTVNDDKSITLGGTRTAASSRSIGTVELKNGDTVTFSASGTYSGVTLVLRKPSGTTISTSSIPQTRTVDSDGLWGFELKGTGDGVEASGTMYCQVEKGSEATSYEPYSGTPTPTNPIAIVDSSGVVVAHTINYLTEGFVDKKVYIGSSGAISTSYVGYGASNDLMNVEPNTEYTFGFTSDVEMYISGFVFFNASKSRVSNIDIESQKVKQATFTVPSNAEYLAIDVVSSRYSSVAIDVSKMSNVHLVKDIPYQSNSINISTIATLRSIGTVADTLVVNQDGSGVLTQNTINIKLTSDGFSQNTTYGNYTVFVKTDASAFPIVADDSTIISSHFIGVDCSQTSNARCVNALTSDNQITIKKASSQLFVRADAFTTIEQFKGFVDSNNVYIQYQLATPTVTNLTSTQVASILALRTYNGTTIVDSEIVKDVTYSADVKGYVDTRCNYVSDEVVIGEWFGEKLYRKCFEITTTNAVQGIYSFGCNVCPINIAGTIDVSGLYKVINTNFAPIEFYITNDVLICKPYDNTTKGRSCKLYIEYIKLDDVATLSEEG